MHSVWDHVSSNSESKFARLVWLILVPHSVTGWVCRGKFGFSLLWCHGLPSSLPAGCSWFKTSAKQGTTADFFSNTQFIYSAVQATTKLLHAHKFFFQGRFYCYRNLTLSTASPWNCLALPKNHPSLSFYCDHSVKKMMICNLFFCNRITHSLWVGSTILQGWFNLFSCFKDRYNPIFTK